MMGIRISRARRRFLFGAVCALIAAVAGACDAVLPLGDTPCLDGCDGGGDGSGHATGPGDAGAIGTSDGGPSFTDPDAGPPVCDGSDCACIGSFKKGNTCFRASALAAYGAAICALVDGTPYCWGKNYFDYRPYDAPSTVPGLDGRYVQIALGYGHGCARAANGAVKCWGSNSVGQLGNGRQNSPLQAVDAVGVAQGSSQIMASEDFSCAVTASGGAKCWGENNMGQLGANLDAGWSSLPLDVVNLPVGVASLVRYYDSLCALLKDGRVACWGDNGTGVFGADPRVVNAPFVFEGLTNENWVAINQISGCALDRSNGVLCWGQTLTTEEKYDTRPVPIGPLGSTPIAQLRVTAYYACVLTAAGAVKCWGDSPGGSIAPTATSSLDVPTLGSGVARVVVATGYACAILNTGEVRCWGNNSDGQLGNGSSDSRSDDPVPVVGLPEPVVDVRAQAEYACALTKNGYVWCWGGNYDDELTRDRGQLQKSPVPLPILSR